MVIIILIRIVSQVLISFTITAMIIFTTILSKINMIRIVCESVSRVGWTNELLQLVRGPVTSAFRLRHTQSLFTALDNVRDIVQITDSEHKVTWVNQTAEKVLGYSRTEVVGRDIRELHSSGSSTNEQTDNHVSVAS